MSQRSPNVPEALGVDDADKFIVDLVIGRKAVERERPFSSGVVAIGLTGTSARQAELSPLDEPVRASLHWSSSVDPSPFTTAAARPPAWFVAKETIAGVHIETVWSGAKNGALYGRKLGREWRFTIPAVREWILTKTESSEDRPDKGWSAGMTAAKAAHANACPGMTRIRQVSGLPGERSRPVRRR